MFPQIRSLFFACALVAGCGDGGGNTNHDLAHAPDMGGDDGMTDGGGTDQGPKITMCPAAGAAPLASGTCEVTAGSAAKLITATVLTPGEVFRGGQVLVDDTGKIACVGCDCSAMGAGATTINCPTGVLSPGLINSHDHISFQGAPGVDSGERYEQRNDWRGGKRGHKKLSSGGSSTNDQVRWGELRRVMAGETSTVSSQGSTTPLGFLRNLDNAGYEEGLAQPAVDFETFPLEASSDYAQIVSGCGYSKFPNVTTILGEDAYLPHIAEGVDTAARNEFLCTSSTMGGGVDITLPQSAFIHAIALKPADYSNMGTDGTALIWSPRSNIRLYGDTAQAPLAARMGVLIALGTDWVPSGSMNLLRELHCADDLNQKYFDKFFNDEQLWLMVTRNAAMVTATDDVIGTIQTGLVADLSIYNGAGKVDHRAVLDAQPADVVLVMRGGKVLYGDAPVVTGLGVASCDAIDVCGTAKSACVQGELAKNLAALTTAAGTVYPLFFCNTAPTNEPSCTPTRPVSVNQSTIYTGVASGDDSDGDGIPDATDNCPKVFNPIRPVDDGKQADVDADGVGDACDPCPFDAGSTNCTMLDTNDVDKDGIPNAMDNCPMVANADQLDTDMDGKGDVCDACPMDANPGMKACPSSIYAIKMGTTPVGAIVSIAGAVVTGKVSNGYFLQMREGDPGYMGAENSGIFVFQAAPTVSVGDLVDVTAGTVTMFNGQIELSKTTTSTKSTGGAAPAPITMSGGAVLTPADLATGTKAAALEGVIVRLANVSVTDIAPPPGAGDTAPTNEFVVGGGVRVNDLFFAPGSFAFPPLHENYALLTGILELRNGNYKIEPRSSGDLVFGAPALTSFGPPAFIRVGQTNQSTIPQPMMVSLTRPATTATMVTITTLSAGVGVPASVTIPANMMSAEVKLSGLSNTNGPVDVTASLAGVDVVGRVSVIDAAQTPVLTNLQPATANTVAGGVVPMTVTLDVPAPAGGTVVTLTSTTANTVPASVTVLQDQLTAAFNYTQMGTPGTDTVTASFGGVNKTAMISVNVHLVINEVDYDSVGTDLNEFIEIYNPNSVAVDMTNLAIVFVNGSNSTEYSRVNLSGMIGPDEYLVVASSTVMVDASATFIKFVGAQDQIQNGAPDGVALIDKTAGTVIDALSYEGSITAAIITGFTGTRTLVEGTALPTAVADSNTVAGSLIRNPNGKDNDTASVDWVFTTTPTPGSANIKTP